MSSLAKLFGQISVCALLTNCALIEPAYYKSDRLDVLQEQVENADLDDGDELIICPEDAKTKLRAIIIPDMYGTGMISMHFGARTRLKLVDCESGGDVGGKCLIEQITPEANTREEELAKRKLINSRHILFVNRKGQYVDKNGVRLTGYRWSKPTIVRTCDKILPDMATSSVID